MESAVHRQRFSHLNLNRELYEECLECTRGGVEERDMTDVDEEELEEEQHDLVSEQPLLKESYTKASNYRFY